MVRAWLCYLKVNDICTLKNITLDSTELNIWVERFKLEHYQKDSVNSEIVIGVSDMEESDYMYLLRSLDK